jgi:hypothetical protein
VGLLAGDKLSTHKMSGDNHSSGDKHNNQLDPVSRQYLTLDSVTSTTFEINSDDTTNIESGLSKTESQHIDLSVDDSIPSSEHRNRDENDGDNTHDSTLDFDQLRSDGGDPSIRPPADREEPVGEPVVRSDPAVTGQRAREAVEFDPADPESIELAARTVRAFSENTVGADDNVFILRGAAACAALVRGVGSYKQAVERAGGDVSISFVRKWARVHDLPQSIRRHVARGDIAPTAAKHIARVSGLDRLDLAWAVVDADLTVREVRRIASKVDDDTGVAEVLAEQGTAIGSIELSLPIPLYRELRRRASVENCPPGRIVSDALEDAFETK